MGLKVQIELKQIPYPTTIPEDEFRDAFEALINEIATIIEEGFRDGTYAFPNLGICIMNPTRGLHVSNANAILALVGIGEGTKRVVENAMGKTFPCRMFGLSSGVLARDRPHCLSDGYFPHRGAVIVNGTPVGTSGQTGEQDEQLSEIIGTKFNQMIAELRAKFASGDDWYGKLPEITQLAILFRA